MLAPPLLGLSVWPRKASDRVDEQAGLAEASRSMRWFSSMAVTAAGSSSEVQRRAGNQDSVAVRGAGR